MNPFHAMYDAFNHGTSRGKLAGLPDGPVMVDLEPTALCNMRCTMCPTGLQALGRPAGFMSAETYGALLEKTQPFKSALRFIGFGEPLMHPDIVGMVARASEAGRLSHINTNGSKLTPPLAEQLVAAGLSSIKFSFQGTDSATYLAMRRTDFFEGLLEAIATMRRARGGERYPYIAASTSTTDETPEMVEAFRARMAPLVDGLSIGKTIFEYIDMAAVPPKHRARLEAAAELSTVTKRHPAPCPEIYEKLTVHWDGAVRVCCNDWSGTTDLGNIVDDEMATIWRHPTMEMYRGRVAERDYSLHLCDTCWDYMDLTEETK